MLKASSPVRAMSLLAASAVAVPLTGSVVETAMATVTIPAGAMGPNSGLRIVTRWSMTSSANNKIARARLGGIVGSVVQSIAYTTNTIAQLETGVWNRNSASSQYNFTASSRPGDAVYAGTAQAVTAVNMAAAQDLVISGQLALGTETLTLESYEVWLMS